MVFWQGRIVACAAPAGLANSRPSPYLDKAKVVPTSVLHLVHLFRDVSRLFLVQGDHSGCVKPPVDIKTKVRTSTSTCASY